MLFFMLVVLIHQHSGEIVFRQQDSNVVEDRMGKFIAYSVLKCANVSECVGVKLMVKDGVNFSFNLLKSKTCVYELEKFLSLPNIPTLILIRSDFNASFPDLLEFSDGKYVSKYENITYNQETVQFAQLKMKPRYSLAQYQNGFNFDNENYFVGLNVLSKLTYVASNFSIVLNLIEKDSNKLLKIYLNTPITCSNGYKMDSSVIYNGVSQSWVSNQLNSTFQVKNRHNTSAKEGFGFWSKDEPLISHNDDVFIRHFKNEHSYKFKTLIISIEPNSLD
ncbi:hypothetical protein SNEBB_008140 [Seison nebaliae]|nr:hypothetical protein SNEBB_008140 [Seison nebaliae]